MEKASLVSKLARDSKCPACRGTGKRGRGKCGACSGSGAADLNHPRVQFNWGFHDSALETSLKGGARVVVETGPQSTRHVSAEANLWYALGYSAGLEAVSSGSYRNNSEPAWLDLVGVEAAARYCRH